MRHAIRLTKEQDFGVFRSTVVPGDQIHIHLTKDNAFTMRKNPEIWMIQSAAFNGRKIRRGSQKAMVAGSLSTLLFPAQAAYIFDWAINLVGEDPDCQDLESVTIDEMITLEDLACTRVYRRYTGVKVGAIKMMANNSGQTVLVGVDLTLVGRDEAIISSSDFPNPSGSDYPDQDPYVFQDTTGTLIVGGVRTNYSSIGLDITNMITPRFDEFPLVTRIRWHNRDVTFSMSGLYKDQADRDAYLGIVPRAISFAFTDGTETAAFDLQSRNYLSSVADSLPLDGDYEQTLTFDSMYDVAANADITATVTP